MTYAFTQDVPIDAAFYQRIVEGLGDTPPKGLIAHIALGGWCLSGVLAAEGARP